MCSQGADVTVLCLQVKAIAAEAGVRFLALGFDPVTAAEDAPHVTYSVRPLLRTLLAGRDDFWDAIDNSCSVQVRLEVARSPRTHAGCSQVVQSWPQMRDGLRSPGCCRATLG